MTRKVLKNKPLLEAIFELRWKLQERGQDVKIDPHYKILIGTMYGRLKDQYPFHEQLPTAAVPDEIAAYVVQHRFRKEKDEWPLVQLGPGIITVNDTKGYIWEDFEKRIAKAVRTLLEAYPESEKSLRIESALLRYIDAIDFDFGKDDIFSFIKENMKINIGLYPRLFEGTEVASLPLGFDWRFIFQCSKPKGAVYLRFGRGKKREADALMWETMVKSASDDAPNIHTGIKKWLEDAHNLTDDWFFKILEGELQRRFE